MWLSEESFLRQFAASLLSLDPAAQKAADAEVRKARANAINYGDCLVGMIFQPEDATLKLCPSPLASDPARVVESLILAAVVQLDHLIEDGWMSGKYFSDKPRVLQALHHIPQRCRDPKAVVAGARCLSRICVMESPNEIWEPFLEAVITQQLYASDDVARFFYHNFLSSLCELAETNVDLWRWLVQGACSRIPLTVTTSKGQALKLVAYEALTQHTPHTVHPPYFPAAVIHEVYNTLISASQHIVSAGLTDVTCSTLTSVHTIIRRASTPPDMESENWKAIVQHTLQVLARVGPSFAKATSEVERFVAELLESLQLAYSTAECHFTTTPALTVFATLLAFGFDPNDDEDVGVEAFLTDILEDGTVLSGCASGRPCEIAASIMQLFIDYDQGLMKDVVQAWISATANAGQQGDVANCVALCRMITAVAKECESTGISMLDTADETAAVIQTIAQLLKLQLPAMLRARVLYALSTVISLSRNIQACIFSFQLASSDCSATSPLVRSMAVMATFKAFSGTSPEVSAALDPFITEQLVSAAFGLIVGVPPATDALTELRVYCCIRSLSTLLDMFPRLGPAVWSQDNFALSHVVVLALHCAGQSTMVQQLSVLGRELVESHAVTGNCIKLQQVFGYWLQVLQGNPSHPSMHALLESAQKLATCNNCECRKSLQPMYQALYQFAASQGPHDDTMLRSLACTFGASLCFVSDAAVPEAATGCAALIREAATKPKGSSMTLSTVSVALGLATIRHRGLPPTFLAEFVNLVVDHSGRCTKDFNLPGAILPVSASIALKPADSLTALTSVVPPQKLLSYLSIWVSLFPFADRRSQHYSILAWNVILSSIRDLPSLVELLNAPIRILVLKTLHSSPERVQDIPCIDALYQTLSSLSTPQPILRMGNFSVDEHYSAFDPKHQLTLEVPMDNLFSAATAVATRIRQMKPA
jgi:hypothetical protein